MTTPLTKAEQHFSPLQADLIAMLRAARAAERDLFGSLSDDEREAGNTIGEWSAKDVQGHLAAWRAIEARRLDATARGVRDAHPGDPAEGTPIDESNAALHGQRVNWSWAEVDAEADASIEALVEVIGRSTSEALCECNDDVAGIGANGANHAMGHLSDIARMGAGGQERFGAFGAEIEAILRGNHLPPRDSGVILYNLACHRALAGELDEARRVLRAAFARRPDLVTFAVDDEDLMAVRGEIATLAAG